MSRLYSAQVSGVSVTAAQDIFEILAATARPILIHGWSLFQTSDVGDAAEEILRIETVRGVGTVTSGSGGTTPTAQPLNDGDAAVSATVEANNTTRMVVGTGALDTLEEHGWNVRVPWVHFYTPELRSRIAPADRWTLSLPVAPADALTVGASVWFEEI